MCVCVFFSSGGLHTQPQTHHLASVIIILLYSRAHAVPIVVDANWASTISKRCSSDAIAVAMAKNTNNEAMNTIISDIHRYHNYRISYEWRK